MQSRISVAIALMCLLDTGATQFEVTHRLAEEGNPLIAPLITAGWQYVWLLKIGLAALVICTGNDLWRSLIGRLALRFVLGAHLWVMGVHALIFAIVAGWV